MKKGKRGKNVKKMNEKETLQQVVYNEMLYLPLKNMGIKDGTKIKKIIKDARIQH